MSDVLDKLKVCYEKAMTHYERYVEPFFPNGRPEPIIEACGDAIEEIQRLREVIDLVYVDMKNKGYCDQQTFRLVIECRKEKEE